MEAPKIYQTIAQVMQEINAISKGRKNQQQGFSFRGIDDVMNELHPVMAKCGLFVVPEVLEENRTEGKTQRGGAMFYTRLKIKFTFYASDGSNVSAVVIGEAMDTGDKASNKALSIGLKYAMIQVFCIPTEDEKDPDALSPELTPGPEAQQAAKKAYSQKKPQLAGGPDTPQQHEEINQLLGSRLQSGAPVFTQADFNAIGELRKTKTADEVIAQLKNEIAIRRETNNVPQPQDDAGASEAFDKGLF